MTLLVTHETYGRSDHASVRDFVVPVNYTEEVDVIGCELSRLFYTTRTKNLITSYTVSDENFPLV